MKTSLLETDSKQPFFKITEPFIKALKEKLIGIGNSRSIFLNAVPGNLKARFDLFDLSFNATNNGDIDHTAEDLLNLLLTKRTFHKEITFKNKNISSMSEEEKRTLNLYGQKIDNICIEVEDCFIDTGINTFGIGYPLFVYRLKKDVDKVVIAPVLIWTLEIKRSPRQTGWIIERTEDNVIKVNSNLLKLLEDDMHQPMPCLDTEFDDNLLKSTGLVSYLKDLLSDFVDQLPSECRLEKCLSKKDLESLAKNKSFIQWSAVMAPFHSANETIIEALDNVEKNIDNYQKENEDVLKNLKPCSTSVISAFEVDPSQNEILNSLNKNEVRIIQGPPGTGKSQTLSSIISNALASGSKVLVVCEKRTALDVIKSNLSKKGLDDYILLIEDASNDRQNVVKKARQLLEKDNVFDDVSERVKAILYRFNDEKAKVNTALNNVANVPLFLSKNWKHYVGLYLKCNSSPFFASIYQQLDNYPITTNSPEYYYNSLRTIKYAHEVYLNKSRETFRPKKSCLLISTIILLKMLKSKCRI